MPSDTENPATSRFREEPGAAGIQPEENSELGGRLRKQLRQLSVLQQLAGFFAAMPKTSQVAKMLIDLLQRELNAKTGAVWFKARQAAIFKAKAGFGVESQAWNDWRLPAPNPFPHFPMLLLQPNWLEKQVIQPAMGEPLGGKGELDLFYMPFEYNSALMGFAIFGLAPDTAMDDQVGSLALLGHQVAASVFNSYLFADLTEQRDELKLKLAELEKANEALVQLDYFKNEFLIITSHELRTPLTGVLGLTKLVMDGLYEDESEMRQMLGDSYSSASYLLKLLNDILDLAKIESGQLDIVPRPVPVFERFEEIKLIAGSIPKKPGVAVIWPEGLDQMPEMLADPDRFSQVLVNLLSNALKFTNEGSVSVLVERDIGFIHFSVVDTGIGISPENQAKLFQKFVQAGEGRTRVGGSGLGLVISKHIVEMMGGNIAMHSGGEGKGTTIRFTVPIA